MDDPPISAQVRDAREQMGRTIADVAREAEVDPAHLNRFERGLRGMESEPLGRVLAALGLRLLPPAQSSAVDGVVPPAGLPEGEPPALTEHEFTLPSEPSAA